VDGVAGTAAGGADRARDEVGPDIDVAERIADDGGLAGRPRRRVDARDALARHREETIGIVVAQVALHGERKAREVGELLQVVGMDAFRFERPAVVGDVVVRVANAPAQPLELQRAQLVGARALDRLELARQGSTRRHGASSLSATGMTVRPVSVAERPRTSATRSPARLVTTMS
jgi:hypothetical protein